MSFRTDRNNNPVAFTTAIAAQAGLVLNVDYEVGDSFTSLGTTYYTAKLLRDPVGLTIQVINKIGFFTNDGQHVRWEYVPSLVSFMWGLLTEFQKTHVVALMYKHEGGIALTNLFGPSPVNLQFEESIQFGDKLNNGPTNV